MRLTKTQAFQHRARALQEGEKDLREKFLLISILRRRFGLHGLTGEVLRFGDDCYRLPDVLVRSTNPMYAIELDGAIHGNGDKISESQKNRERQEDYETRNDVKLVIINKELTNYGEEEIVRICKEAGMKAF